MWRLAGIVVRRRLASSRPSRLDKPGRTDNIDGIIALAMALDRLEDRPQAPRLIGWL
jgi:hypothetical protein